MGSVNDLVQGSLAFSVEPYMRFRSVHVGHVEFLACSLRTCEDRLHLARLVSSLKSRFPMVCRSQSDLFLAFGGWL